MEYWGPPMHRKFTNHKQPLEIEASAIILAHAESAATNIHVLYTLMLSPFLTSSMLSASRNASGGSL